MKPFIALFVDCRNVRSEGVTKFIFSVPIEEANEALQYLGGLPPSEPGALKAVVIARMAGPVDKLLGEDDGDRSEGDCAPAPGGG